MSKQHHNEADPSRLDDAGVADDVSDDSANHNPPTPTSGSSDPAVEREIGGRAGPDPTRYGDWEKNGRCIDF